MLDRTRPRVVLLDLRLTGGSEYDGLSLCAAITQRYPDSRVLVLTSSADEWLILESIKQGAKGFALKDVDLTELVREILSLLARGLSNVAIGQRLYISAATVKFHAGNVMQKLGARRRAEAVYAASKLGLI